MARKRLEQMSTKRTPSGTEVMHKIAAGTDPGSLGTAIALDKGARTPACACTFVDLNANAMLAST